MSIATNGMIQRSRHDEFTPLLSDAKNSQITKYNRPSIRSDEESIVCTIPLVNPLPETSRNIAGVISILLLGRCNDLDLLFKDSLIQSILFIHFLVLNINQYTQSHNSLGVFIANADGSLVLATSGTISSEFNDLGNAGWLISSYMLAMCATQSLVCCQACAQNIGFCLIST